MKLPDKKTIKNLKDLASLGQKVVLVIGICVLFFYFLSEQIAPDNLSLGDAFLLIMAALGFGIVMLVGIIYGLVGSIAIVQLMIVIVNWLKKVNKVSLVPLWQGKLMIWISIIFLLLTTILVVMGERSGTASDMKLEQTVLCFLAIGILLLGSVFLKREGEEPRGLTANFVLAVVMIVTPLLVFHPAVMNITMVVLGVRSSPGSLVVIDNSAYPGIEEVLKESGFNIRFCQLPSSNAWGTTDARVVWNGGGETSFVNFIDPSSTDQTQYTMSIPIPKASLHVFRPWHWKMVCDNTLSGHND